MDNWETLRILAGPLDGWRLYRHGKTLTACKPDGTAAFNWEFETADAARCAEPVKADWLYEWVAGE